MKVLSKQRNSEMCIICGVNNKIGVKAPFYNMEDGSVISLFKFKPEHQSYPGRVHGGMITCMLDEIIGRALWVESPTQYGVTMSIQVKFRKQIPYDVPLKATGKIVKQSEKFFEGEGKIFSLDGVLLAESTAHYFKMPLESIGEINQNEVNVMVPDDVKEIN